MKHLINIQLFILGMMLTFGCSDLSHDDGIDDVRYDYRVSELIAMRAGENAGSSDFPTGSLYRLFAFTQKYDNATPNPYIPATTLRFDQLVSEQETGEDGHKYIKIANANDDLSFKPSTDREKAEDPFAKRTIDFYGFTYDGENYYPAKDAKENFVPLKRENGASYDGDDPGSYYYETPDLSVKNNNGFPKDSLSDLMWGRLLNQNVLTALPHSHIPFSHCFSQLTFEVMQQEGNETGIGRYDISIADISLINVYRQGRVNLKTGKLTVTGDPCSIRINPSSPQLLSERIPVNSSRFSTLLVFPTHGDSYDLSGGISAPGGNKTYALQAQVTLKGDTYVLNRFANKAYGAIDKVEPVDGEDGVSTLVLPSFELPRTVQSGEGINEDKLYLKAGYSYTVRISFMEDGVFIVTQIPQKVRWIHGEGDENGIGDGSDGVFDYQLLATGNPVYFGGSVWMDRNLGAEEWNASDPDTDPDRLQGYYYQPGRNIPYWPFYRPYYNSTKPLPTWHERWNVPLVNSEGTGFMDSQMPLFPILPDYMVRTARTKWYKLYEERKGYWQWAENSMLASDYVHAANDIVEKEEYERWTNGGADSKTYMRAAMYPRKKWENGVSEQPVPPGWRIPTMDEFLQIYPSCSAAGNYAFITGPTNTVSLQWDDRGNMPDSILRVCVPYYRPGMLAPADTKKDTQGMSYRPGYEVWEQFYRDYEESGNFPSDITWSSPRTDYNNGICPAYDPLPGQVSVYLIVRKHDAIGSCIEAEEVRRKIGTNAAKNLDLYRRSSWGTVYAIKALHTPEAYAMRWRIEVSPNVQTLLNGKLAPVFYLRIDRYKLEDPVNAELDAMNYENLVNWDNPSATMFLPNTGMANLKSSGNGAGLYYYGIESMYLTSTMSDAGYYCVWLKGPWANAPLNNVRIGLSPLRPFKAGDVNSINNFTGQLRLIKR